MDVGQALSRIRDERLYDKVRRLRVVRDLLPGSLGSEQGVGLSVHRRRENIHNLWTESRTRRRPARADALLNDPEAMQDTWEEAGV